MPRVTGTNADINTFDDAIRTRAVNDARRTFDQRRPADLRLVPHTPASAIAFIGCSTIGLIAVSS